MLKKLKVKTLKFQTKFVIFMKSQKIFNNGIYFCFAKNIKNQALSYNLYNDLM